MAENSREWRHQLVGDIRDELTSDTIRFLERTGTLGELVGHGIERAREFCDFIAPVLARARRQVPGTEPVRGGLEIENARSNGPKDRQ